MKRFFPLISCTVFLIAVSVLSVMHPEKKLIYNYTDSLPHGFYMIENELVRKGSLIAFHPAKKIQRMMTERGYLREGGYLMKFVAAEPGDSVCTRQGKLQINGEDFGRILETDRKGKRLPAYRYNGRLEEGYLVAIKGKEDSFDSRYFGPISKESVIGIARPLWLFTGTNHTQ
ncbi:conjugative transfer signal peptidase TraF [Chlorobium sp. N1]|uniref:conjugative transfer signal peptidase TraF n=1 Tax=Chlorobium sp. N1 TaxID=2491138 RepID=UPI001039CDB3|nr:conjugative transfer signal peptidase TraF [Chlorobium sp. N1]TCD46910.1 conjugative transfer signal peptidase TraF [Chlorobium sp. N1]